MHKLSQLHAYDNITFAFVEKPAIYMCIRYNEIQKKTLHKCFF